MGGDLLTDGRDERRAQRRGELARTQEPTVGTEPSGPQGGEAVTLAHRAGHESALPRVGDVIEPEHGIAAIGSGGAFAQAAARAMVEHTELAMADVAEKSLKIAADICVYTNDQIIVETLS